MLQLPEQGGVQVVEDPAPPFLESLQNPVAFLDLDPELAAHPLELDAGRLLMLLRLFLGGAADPSRVPFRQAPK